MDDESDKKLAARYKEVFDHYRDDGAAEGWARLQANRSRRKPFPFYRLSAAAAVLLLAIGLGWFFVNREWEVGNRKEMVKSKQKSVNSERETEDKLKAESGRGKDNTDEEYANKNPLEKSNAENSIRKPAFEKQKFNIGPGKIKERYAKNISAKTASENEKIAVAPIRSDAVFLSAKSVRTSTETMFAGKHVKQSNLLANTPVNIFADEKPPAKTASNKKERKDRFSQRAFALSVFAGSQVNYGRENTRRNARPTGGLQAELALGKRFSIGLGAGIADYQLAYADGLPPIAGQKVASPAADNNSAVTMSNTRATATGKRTPLFVQKASAQNSPAQANALVKYSYVSTSAIKIDAVTARFTAVEVPLAFSWKALTGKTGLYLTAAVNSTWMVREAYQADFSVQNFEGINTPVNSQHNNETFTAFTPFSSMQFSVGLKPGGSRSRLAIEPFARFPLQNQGLEQLRYGAAGLNLKFRLNDTNKK